MATVPRILIDLLILLGLFLTAVAGYRQAVQHRAIYSGGLTFVGAADGLFESRYHRMFLWKAEGYTDALPHLTVHIEDTSYALDALTPGLVVSLGGSPDEGALYDSSGAVLQYRFKGGRLTWLSQDSKSLSSPLAQGGNVRGGVFSLSRSGGELLLLPASDDQLVRALGAPERRRWVFAQ